uniref:Sex-determining region Y protein n=1 Tax=Leucosolenia complicata TaxID=433461 RepID=I7DAY9_9METZ|nr:Sox6 [Leucosolenia complicata]
MEHGSNSSIEMPVIGADSDPERTGDHVKRPMNAFMVWAKTERRQLAMRLPGMPNSEVSKILGDMWRRLPDEQKEQYRSESEKIRRKHKAEHPDYRYHPKRPRKNKAVDANSAMAGALIESSKMSRPLTPTMNPRMMSLTSDGRPHSAPPSYQHDSVMSVGNSGIASMPNSVSTVSQWWSPASTPPTSSFASGQGHSVNPSMGSQFQTSLPASPSSQDLGGSLSASSSSVWLKQNSPGDSSTNKHRTSPSLMTHPSRRHSQSPLVGAVSSAARHGSTAYSSSIPMTTFPTSGSLLPAMSGAYYNNNTNNNSHTADQTVTGARPVAELQRAYSAVSSPSVNDRISPTGYESTAPMAAGASDQQRDNVIAPSAVFYPAYQPATAYLPQAAAYGWLDNRTHFVLPEQIANTQHSQIFQQSVAS